MTHDAFFDAVGRGDVARVYLFHGEEAHIKRRALEALRKRLLPDGLEAMNETNLQNPPPQDVIAAAETLPFMGERRLIVVRDCALIGAGRVADEAAQAAAMANYLDRVPDTACLVFYARGLADGRKKLTQALNRRATVVRFDPLADVPLARWMAAQVKPKAISPQNAALLAFTSGRDLLTLTQELHKLAAYIGERDEITREDIEAVATKSLECTVFQMVDALVAGREAEVFRLLSAMLEMGESRIGILAMMARQYRNLFHVRCLMDQKTPLSQMQQRVGVPPFAFDRLREQARNADAKALREKLRLCVGTDYAIKSGRMREDAALERALFMLCGIPPA